MEGEENARKKQRDKCKEQDEEKIKLNTTKTCFFIENVLHIQM